MTLTLKWIQICHNFPRQPLRLNLVQEHVYSLPNVFFQFPIISVCMTNFKFRLYNVHRYLIYMNHSYLSFKCASFYYPPARNFDLPLITKEGYEVN